MNQKRILETPDAPAAVGHYSQGTTNGQVVFTSGQIALQSDGESITDESITVQTRQCLDNVMAILEEAGANPETILKMKIFLTDVEMYEEMNTVYETYFADEPPARTVFEVGNLPLGADVEIESIATINSNN